MVKKAIPVDCQQLFVVTMAYIAMSNKQINLADRNDQLATHIPLCQAGKKKCIRKKGEEKKKQKQRRATIWRGPGKAGMNHHLVHSVFPWHGHKEGQWMHSRMK